MGAVCTLFAQEGADLVAPALAIRGAWVCPPSQENGMLLVGMPNLLLYQGPRPVNSRWRICDGSSSIGHVSNSA